LAHQYVLLRVVAVLGLSLEIAYFWQSGGDLRAGIGWDLIFICINLYQVYRLVKDRMSLRLPESDRELLRKVFTGLDDAQIARLLLAGEFRDIESGTSLAEENRPLEEVFFICSGRVRVTIAGRQVAHLEPGSFVGEVAFLTHRPAMATVITEGAVRALAFETEKLSRFFRHEAEVAGLIYQLLGRELANKIKISNSLISSASMRSSDQSPTRRDAECTPFSLRSAITGDRSPRRVRRENVVFCLHYRVACEPALGLRQLQT
jgi:CRP-like cAMP-binding protein